METNCEYLEMPCSGHNEGNLLEEICKKDWKECSKYKLITEELYENLFKYNTKNLK